MIRVHIICEGQTEEQFIKNVLAPSFATKGIFLAAAILGSPGHKGGNVREERVLRDIELVLKNDSQAICTTFFDYYGIHPRFCGYQESLSRPTVAEKQQCLCGALAQRVCMQVGETFIRRFIPYIQMHEFEALLFSDPQKLAEGLSRTDLHDHFQAITDGKTPEDINNSLETAPSKRIIHSVHKYKKVLDGTRIAKKIGLETMRHQCRLFHQWLCQLENLAA